MQARDFWPGPHDVRFRRSAGHLADGPNDGRGRDTSQTQALHLSHRRQQAITDVSRSENRPQCSKRIWSTDESRLESAGETVAQVRRQVEQSIDHGATVKKAAFGTPSAGTTSARSR